MPNSANKQKITKGKIKKQFCIFLKQFLQYLNWSQKAALGNNLDLKNKTIIVLYIMAQVCIKSFNLFARNP